MTLVVETGLGVPTANSYGTLAEANEYHSVRGNAWADTSAATSVLLIRQAIAAGNSLTITYDSAVESYSFVSALNPAFANEILVGASLAATVQNLIDALNGTGTPGTQYSAALVGSGLVTSSALVGGKLTLTSKVKGDLGNSIVVETSPSVPLLKVLTPMSGGIADREIRLIKAAQAMKALYGGRWLGDQQFVDQGLDFPRTGLSAVDGTSLDGTVPEAVKHCQFEMALVTDTLVPNSEFSGTTSLERLKIGPMEIQTAFSSKTDQPVYRMAEGLLGELILGSSMGRIVRG